MDKSLRDFAVICGLIFSHAACAAPKANGPTGVYGTPALGSSSSVILGMDANGQPNYMVYNNGLWEEVTGDWLKKAFYKAVIEAEKIMCGDDRPAYLPDSFTISAAVVSVTYNRADFCAQMKKKR